MSVSRDGGLGMWDAEDHTLLFKVSVAGTVFFFLLLVFVRAESVKSQSLTHSTNKAILCCAAMLHNLWAIVWWLDPGTGGPLCTVSFAELTAATQCRNVSLQTREGGNTAQTGLAEGDWLTD